MRMPHNKPPRTGKEEPLHLRTAYAICRGISRAAARNFHYGILLLPRRKRDALSAVYAYMRHADDIVDDPVAGVEEKRTRLHAWRESLHRVIAGGSTNDPVLMATAETQQRYRIPIELLDQLIAGTAMDLCTGADTPNSHAARAQESEGVAVAGPQVQLAAAYATFADLYDYCYHVASVVGLVCIRIFGYRDPSAEQLAEHCGIAFQLTNIIRDVKEDAAMGRVYLPHEDLAKFGLVAAELAQAEENAAVLAERFRPLLEFEAKRAQDFYGAAKELIPLVEEDSQPALWVLVTIYQNLLDRIAQRGYDVFGPKISLTTAEKLSIFLKGAWRRLT